MAKIQSAQQWVTILNEALKALRQRVDDGGNGVFRLNDVFEPLGYKSQTSTISKHLQNLRLLQPVQKQPDGSFLWRVDMKKRITLRDVQKSRQREATRIKSRADGTQKRAQAKPASAKPESSLTSVTSVTSHQKIRYDEHISALLLIIEELEAKVSRLEARNHELKRENASLAEQIESISNADLDRRVTDVLLRYQHTD